MKVEIRGLDSLDRKLRGIAGGMTRAAQTGTRKAAEDTAQIAMRLAPGKVRGAIRAEVLGRDGSVLSARVFNDTSLVPWSSYTEFGTGNYVDDEGVSEAIRLKRAKSVPWYIHVSMVPPSFARYGYPVVVGADGQKYYEVDGMHPKPYMQPAAFRNRDENVKTLAEALDDMIREAVR